MIADTDLNWRVFCEVVKKESGHDPCLYEYALVGRYWSECTKCGQGLAYTFHTVDEAAIDWRRLRVSRKRRCDG